MDSMPVTVASVQASDTLPDLLQQDSNVEGLTTCMFLKEEQRKDPKIMELIQYLEGGILPREASLREHYTWCPWRSILRTFLQ